MMITYDVYFAAPFFNVSERELNVRIISALEAHGLKVFSPSRDGIVARDEIGESANWRDISARVWDCDTKAIMNSKALFAVIDGRSIDEGVCVEIGLAAAIGKPIIAFSTDDRKQFPWGHNPMVIHPISAIVSSPDDAALEVARILQN